MPRVEFFSKINKLIREQGPKWTKIERFGNFLEFESSVLTDNAYSDNKL